MQLKPLSALNEAQQTEHYRAEWPVTQNCQVMEVKIPRPRVKRFTGAKDVGVNRNEEVKNLTGSKTARSSSVKCPIRVLSLPPPKKKKKT